MPNPGPSDRPRGLRPLGRLLGRTTSAWGDTWRSVVGGSVAAYSVCLGPNDTGDLRVMVRTLSDRDELVAREEDVLSSWNTWAERHGGPQAKALVCWVRNGTSSAHFNFQKCCC